VLELDDRADLPSGRAGLDLGDLVPVGGDYFGHTVNVAARLQHFAKPGTVVVSEAFLEALGEDVGVSHIGRTKLRGVGPVRTFKIRLDDDAAEQQV
jgi:class 3 adenylate cyclase